MCESRTIDAALHVSLVHIEQVHMPTMCGNFVLHVFQDMQCQLITMALVKGDISNDTPVLTRIHSSCMTGEVWKSQRCDCDAQLVRAMQEIERNESGIIIYLQQEGRGIGLLNKIKAYKLQDKGYDTVEANHKLGFKADLRDYAHAAEVLAYFNINMVDLLTNNPCKIENILKYGITVRKRVPLEVKSNACNDTYLSIKKKKLGHMLSNL